MSTTIRPAVRYTFSRERVCRSPWYPEYPDRALRGAPHGRVGVSTPLMAGFNDRQGNLAFDCTAGRPAGGQASVWCPYAMIKSRRVSPWVPCHSMVYT